MIHMEKGYYYSLDRIGSAIWNLLDHHTAVSQIITYLQQQYSGSPEEIKNGVANLLQQLQIEELIIPGSAAQNESPADDLLPTAPNGNQVKTPFVAPELHKYTDMEDLLLLDPIHEVDETGWPAVPEEG